MRSAPPDCRLEEAAECESADDWDNKRFERRRETRQVARIVMGENSNGIRCEIRDQSSRGAMLELESSGGSVPAEYLPQTFRLYLPYDRAEVDCRIAWSDGMKVGVQFVSPIKAVARSPRAKHPAKKEPQTLLGRLFYK